MSDEMAPACWRLCDEADLPFVRSTLGAAARAERLVACLIEEIRLRVLPPHTD